MPAWERQAQLSPCQFTWASQQVINRSPPRAVKRAGPFGEVKNYRNRDAHVFVQATQQVQAQRTNGLAEGQCLFLLQSGDQNRGRVEALQLAALHSGGHADGGRQMRFDRTRLTDPNQGVRASSYARPTVICLCLNVAEHVTVTRQPEMNRDNQKRMVRSRRATTGAISARRLPTSIRFSAAADYCLQASPARAMASEYACRSRTLPDSGERRHRRHGFP